ncbi:MAG TPA: molybdopterin-dependent oxidoreductase, partial [Polyangia bacterium]|nr:molybdopterin-dependent oxidoreductase [Polyangia bacterium]
MDRRTFLELIGVAGASTVAGCKGAPVERIYSYLTPPTPIVPGVATYYASVCRECPAGCGIIVKTREARPIKLEGNPAHPVNRGRLCARGQAGVQGLFGRHRIREPMIRIDGKLVPASWDKALAAAAELLVGARTIGLLTGLESGSYDDLWADLGRLFPNLSHVTFEPFSRGAERAASRLVFGLDDLPVVDLSQADYVLSLGADFLDAWVSPVELSRQWAEAHGGVGRRVRLDYLGPRRNLTATAADLFQTVSPESLDAFSRALLAAVAANMPPLPAEQEAAIEAVLAAIPPLPAGLPDISTFGRRLRRARNPVVLFGGTEVLGRNATATHAAVLLVNALLGAVGRSLRYGAHPALAKVDPARRAFELVDRAGSGGR